MQIENCPNLDIIRSPIANYIANIAHSNNFFLSHYEYRYQIQTPPEWASSIWNEKSKWSGGYLPESKYQSFRNDMRIGSFHPGHQSKWSTHELCHSICGFAWNEEFSFLEHTLAARLAELIPVIVFYFFDEINLNRCKKHLNQIWLKMPYCTECEKLIAQQFITSADEKEKYIKEATIFFNKELSAIKKSIKSGKLISHIYGHLDLASDSIYYVKAHEKRINSKEFLYFTKNFTSEFHFNSLELFIDYLENIFSDFVNIFSGKTSKKNAHTKRSKEFWISQDLVWRIYELEKLYPNISNFTQKWILELLENPNDQAIKLLVEDYINIEKKYKLIHHENFFALGYKLNGSLGFSTKMIREGLLSASPNGFKEQELNDKNLNLFLEQLPTRETIGNRFLEILKNNGTNNLLFELECMISYSQSFNTNEFFNEPLNDSDALILNSNIQLLQINTSIIKQFSLKKTDLNKFMIIKKLVNGDVDLIVVEEKLGIFIVKNKSCLFSQIPEVFINDIKEHLIYLKDIN